MINSNELIKNKNKSDINKVNLKNFKLSMKDELFASLAYKLDLKEEQLCNYTSKLESTVKDLKKCKNCKGIDCCNLEVRGYVNYPKVIDDYLIFSYTPCKYKKDELKNESKVTFYETAKNLRNAKMSDIMLDDKARVEVLKYIKEFMDDYPNKKGIYLYGSFGNGKSFILNAVLNELSKKGASCVSVYYPLLLKELKSTFNASDNEGFDLLYKELLICDVLLLDDIGAENNTPWARDEVLGGILQTRMDNGRITFFTSNFDLKELEEHLSETSSGSEKVKARRIIERIKQLSKPIILVGENKRDF